MASICELLIDTDNPSLALELGELAREETQRIEHKFSRYRDDNIVARINSAEGQAVSVDDETASLLDFAETLWKLSEGRFDITSGVLRQIWHFDTSGNVPSPEQVSALL
ncbi:MAG: thiamine biosynthesis protein ApbE, partial [Thalassolituus sp.]